eukprot:g3044.t1
MSVLTNAQDTFVNFRALVNAGQILQLAKSVPRGRLLNEQEWRSMGVQQSRGWVHYAIHRPEPHILLFRRPLGTDPVTGKVVETLARDAKAKYAEEMGIGGC